MLFKMAAVANWLKNIHLNPISLKAVKNIKNELCLKKPSKWYITCICSENILIKVIYRDFQYGRPCRILKNKANLCNLLLYESNWINLILYWIRISLKSLAYQYEMQLLSENPQKCRPFWFSRWPPLPWKRGHV